MRFHPDLPDADPARTLEAWRRFTERGVIDAGVRPHIRSAWERSAAHGCSPLMARADVLSPTETIALLKREARLLEIATPFLAALSRAAGTERHAAMLGDAEGRVLKIVADPLTAADERFPRAGSLLSEAAAGANGIGTPLVDGHYVELVGPEHFIEGFHVFTCQGVPLQASTGTPIGVLSVSVRRIEAARRVRDILFCASEAAECELISARLSELIAAHDEASQVLEALRQDIVQRIATTRLQLEIAARRIAGGAEASEMLRSVEQLIGTFRRQAAIWRNLADDGVGSPEPVALRDFVHDFLGLMATEARVAQVELVEERVEHLVAFDDAAGLARRLLAAVLTALSRAARGSSLRVHVQRRADRAAIGVQGIGAATGPFELSLETPLLR